MFDIGISNPQYGQATFSIVFVLAERRMVRMSCERVMWHIFGVFHKYSHKILQDLKKSKKKIS